MSASITGLMNGRLASYTVCDVKIDKTAKGFAYTACLCREGYGVAVVRNPGDGKKVKFRWNNHRVRSYCRYTRPDGRLDWELRTHEERSLRDMLADEQLCKTGPNAWDVSIASFVDSLVKTGPYNPRDTWVHYDDGRVSGSRLTGERCEVSHASH